MNRALSIQTPSKGWNITLWIVQILLAGMFIMSGFIKVITPIEELLNQLPWAADVPATLIRFIGTVEVLGGIGLLLPSILRIKPSLTIYAAIGIALVMIFAAFFHISRSEGLMMIGVNFILATLALVVAWGRSKKSPILPKK